MYSFKNNKIKKIGIIFFLLILPWVAICHIIYHNNREAGKSMKVVETPEWYLSFIKNKEDIACIKNDVINNYEELINDLLLLKEIPINSDNCDLLFDMSYERIELCHYKNEKKISILKIYTHLGANQEWKNDIQDVFNCFNVFLLQNLTYNIDIYLLLESVGNFLLKNKELPINKKRLIENTLNDYKKLGISLSENKKNRLKEIGAELSESSLKFEMNIQATKNHIIASIEDLSGLSENQIARLEKISDTEYKVGVDYPTYDMIMRYCSNELIRKNLYKEFNTRAYPENIDLLKKIRELNDEKAKIVGYTDYPAMDFANQMAKSVKVVESLFDDIHEITEKKALEEKKILTEFARSEVFCNQNYVINPWDTAYINQLYENKYFKIDQEFISQYFPITHVLNKLLEIYSTFFDVTMELIEYDNNDWKFDHSIKVVRIFEKNGTIIGDLILDLYPRENKYSHACFSSMISPVLKKNNATELKSLPIGLIIGNFNKPTQEHDGLLKYSEVRTLFHEFGHGLHGLFGATEFYSQSGTSVSEDFVETPSQLLEFWLLEENIIQSLSSHYQSKELLSSDVIKKLIAIEFYDMGLFFERQINLAKISLELFLYPDKMPSDIIEEISKKTVRLSYVDSLSQFLYSFGHLASTLYGPKYYVYLWALVYAVDFFSYIKSQNALLNPEVGAKLKNTVLSQGGSNDPFVLIENFLGRPPNVANFYKYLTMY